MLSRLFNLFRMIKIQHTLFALPFAVIGAIMGAGHKTGKWPTKIEWVWLMLAMVSARTSAMIFNRIIDRTFDKLNPRTKDREIPSGKISLTTARVFFVLSTSLFFLSAGMLNWICLVLSPFVLVVMLGYSYSKRFTHYSHFILGLSLGLAPIGAWLGVNPTFHISPVILCVMVTLWVAGFDIIYSCLDCDFDRQYSLKSFPVKYGVEKSLKISFVLHIFMLVALILFSWNTGYWLNWYFKSALFIVTILIFYQHLIVKPDQLEKVNRAFFHTNAIISFVLMLAVIMVN